MVIPKASVGDLLVSEEVAAAVQRGTFVVHAVERLEEALQILVAPRSVADVEARVEARLDAFHQRVSRAGLSRSSAS